MRAMKIFFVTLILTLAFAAPAAAARRVCLDNESESVVVRKKCVSPRYTEVTPSALGGGNIQRILKADEVSLPAEGDLVGNSVTCPDGYFATGGGASITDNNGLNIRRSIPQSGLAGWTVAVEATKNAATGVMSIYAICMSGLTVLEDVEQ